MYTRNTHVIFGIFIAIIVFVILIFYGSMSSPNSEIIENKQSTKATIKQGKSESSDPDYTRKCIQLYKKLRNPDKNLFFVPPLKEPPKEMLDEFTQNGQMPMRKLWYFNEVYSDSQGDSTSAKRVINEEVGYWLDRVRAKQPIGQYGDLSLSELMHYFSPKLRENP